MSTRAKADCDCCGQHRVCRLASYEPIETYACAFCRDLEMCPQCLDDTDNCECEPAPESELPPHRENVAVRMRREADLDKL